MRQLCTSIKSVMKKKLKDEKHSKNKSPPKITFHCPIDTTLIEQWGQAPNFNQNAPSLYLKRLLIYYPKRSKALRPLNMLLASKDLIHEVDRTLNVKASKLVRYVLSKYNRVFLRQLCVGLFSRTCLTEKLRGSIERAIVFPGVPAQSNRQLLVGKKFFVNNKRLKSIMVYEDSTARSGISTWLQYSPFIESITIRNLHYLSHLEQKRIFLASKNHLERVSILGFLSDIYTKDPNAFIDLLNLLTQNKTLKSLNLDIETYIQLDLADIPFEKFKENNISYNIRTLRYSKFKSLKNTVSGLSGLDILGLNLCDSSYTSRDTTLRAHYSQSQQYALNALHLNFFDKSALNLSFLLQSCQHISTLDIITPFNALKELDFAPLQNFDSLKHLYIRLSDFHSNIISLFENLAICFAKNPTLETLFLHTEGSALKGSQYMVPLFGACATSLTKFSIAISPSEIELDTLQDLYNSLSKLRSLKSLNIFSEDANSVTQGFASLAALYETLEEFHLSMPLNCKTQDINLTFKRPHCLMGFSLECNKLESISAWEESLANLRGLTSLKLKMAELNKKTWYNLVQVLKTMEKLERLVLLSRSIFDIKLLEADLNRLFKELPSIKYLRFNKLYDYCDQESPISFVLERNIV